MNETDQNVSGLHVEFDFPVALSNSGGFKTIIRKKSEEGGTVLKLTDYKGVDVGLSKKANVEIVVTKIGRRLGDISIKRWRWIKNEREDQ